MNRAFGSGIGKVGEVEGGEGGVDQERGMISLFR
jgi:hypothetical protein